MRPGKSPASPMYHVAMVSPLALEVPRRHTTMWSITRGAEVTLGPARTGLGSLQECATKKDVRPFAHLR